LRAAQDESEEMAKRKASLEEELKSVELVEKRRSHVALDTEKALTETKCELASLRKEL